MILNLLIAPFFLYVGTEIKNEFSHRKELVAPFIAALAGMALPALIFRLLQPNSAAWGAVMPTDIALVLAVLTFLKIDQTVRLFLLLLAVMDDFLSLIAMAIFYHGKFNLITSASTFLAAAIGFLIPRNEKLLGLLSKWALYVVTPAILITHFPAYFAFNSTVNSYLLARIVGKVVGISLVAWVMLKRNLIGEALLCAMGMTVSVVIANLATSGNELQSIDFAIYLTSISAGLFGYLWLRVKS